MKAFVTGATGYIGRRLVERLLRDGVATTALVRTSGHGLPEGVRTVVGDILAPASLADVGEGQDRLYHLAGMITFDAAKREDLLLVNERGTMNALALAEQWGVRRTVVVSSACTIGLSFDPHVMLDEESPMCEALACANPYLESKRGLERAARAAASSRAVMIVNPTTVYGPGDRTLNSGTLVKTIARSPIIPVPPGGSNVIDVDDVVEGIVAAGEKGLSGRRYILGAHNLAFKEIFSTIAAAVGKRPLLLPVPKALRFPLSLAATLLGKMTGSRFVTPQIIGDLFAFKYYSSARARQELQWSPRYSFTQTIERAVAYYRGEGLI